jgi:hypothetical protein
MENIKAKATAKWRHEKYANIKGRLQQMSASLKAGAVRFPEISVIFR